MTSVCHYSYTCHLLSLHFNDKPVIVTLASPFTHVQRYPDDLLKTGGVNICLLKTIFKMLVGRVKRKRTDAPQILHGWEQGYQWNYNEDSSGRQRSQQTPFYSGDT